MNINLRYLQHGGQISNELDDAATVIGKDVRGPRASHIIEPLSQACTNKFLSHRHLVMENRRPSVCGVQLSLSCLPKRTLRRVQTAVSLELCYYRLCLFIVSGNKPQVSYWHGILDILLLQCLWGSRNTCVAIFSKFVSARAPTDLKRLYGNTFMDMWHGLQLHCELLFSTPCVIHFCAITRGH